MDEPLNVQRSRCSKRGLSPVSYIEKSISSAAHEFFHTIHFQYDAYRADVGYWWWEATATWMAEEVFPEFFRMET